MKHTLNMR